MLRLKKQPNNPNTQPMPTYRAKDYIIDRLRKKKIKFKKVGNELIVNDDDISDHDRLILSRYEPGGPPGKKPDVDSQKIQRPPAVYYNTQWADLYK